MSEDTIRLSDLVPMHGQLIGPDPDLKAAAYDLHQTVQRLSDYYYVAKGPDVPSKICWLGSVSNSQRSARRHQIDFGMLNRYFSNWDTAPTPTGPDFECSIGGDFQRVPASAIYLSRAALIDWLETAGIEPPQVLLSPLATSTSKVKAPRTTLEQREMNSVKLLLNTAFELLHAIAQNGSPLRASAAKLNPDASPGLKAKAFSELANLAGIDMKFNVKTISKYFPNEDELEDLRK